LENEVLLGTSEVSGWFRILQKFKSTNVKEIEIDCVWISGDSAGTIFTIQKYPSSYKDIPDQIYFPPKIFVWLFEILLSFSAASAIVGIIHFLWHYLITSEAITTFIRSFK
jgi:hypothetical protein